MKQTTPDDALIGLLSAIIMQAVEDYQALQKRGAIGHQACRIRRKLGLGKGVL